MSDRITINLIEGETIAADIDQSLRVYVHLHKDGQVTWEARYDGGSIFTEGLGKRLSTAQGSMNRTLKYMKESKIVLSQSNTCTQDTCPVPGQGSIARC